MKMCNCTRLAVKAWIPHVVRAAVLTGYAYGEDVFIPNVPGILSDVPFKFRHFPLCLAFAVSINEAQGQSLKSFSS
jgi:hypothetical protein